MQELRMKPQVTCKKEIAWITVLRGLACILVVVAHTLPPKYMVTTSFNELFRNTLSIISKPCVPLFFMITGYLILPFTGSSPLEFYKKRIPKVLFPLLFWGVIYAALPFLLGLYDAKLFLTELLLTPIKNPEEMGGILWYLFILIGIYLFIPFLTENIYSNEKWLRLYLLIWFSTLFVYIPSHFFPNILGKNPWEHDFNMFVYFSGYLGYVLLGYWLKNSQINVRFFIFLYLFCFVLSELIIYVSYGFLTFGTAIMALCLFVIVREINYNGKYSYLYKIGSPIAKYSFGVYLSHILVYRTLTCHIYTSLGTDWYYALFTIMTTIIGSLAIVKIISYIKYHNYLIG